MRKRAIFCAAILCSSFVIHTTPGYGEAGCEIPFRSDGHLIIVAGSAGRASGMRFMIDTAATGSLIDRKVIKALGMDPLPGESEVAALGHITIAHRFSIPKLRIGSVYAALTCHEADLSGLGVDGILGLDFLREHKGLRSCVTDEVIQGGSFTIDFEKRKLRFGVRQQLAHAAPLEGLSPQIIVETNVQGHSLRLAVDSGSYTIILYKESQMRWLDHRWTIEGPGFYRLGGAGQGRQVILHNLRLENSRWTDLSGIAINLPERAIDGLLPITQLGLKTVHFDFEHNLMSWNK